MHFTCRYDNLRFCHSSAVVRADGKAAGDDNFASFDFLTGAAPKLTVATIYYGCSFSVLLPRLFLMREHLPHGLLHKAIHTPFPIASADGNGTRGLCKRSRCNLMKPKCKAERFEDAPWHDHIVERVVVTPHVEMSWNRLKEFKLTGDTAVAKFLRLFISTSLLSQGHIHILATAVLASRAKVVAICLG